MRVASEPSLPPSASLRRSEKTSAHTMQGNMGHGLGIWMGWRELGWGQVWDTKSIKIHEGDEKTY